jgi:LPS-assembly protein
MENYLRLHSTLEFYVPIDVRFATVKPFVEVMATRWSDFEEAGDVQESGNGTFAEITVDGDTIDRRTYSLGYEIALNEIYKKYSRFRHTVYNILKYEEIPDLDQSTIPERIEDDLIEGTKSYTYTLRNYFEAENWKLNATLEQSYDTMLTDNQFRPLVAKFDYDYNNSLQLYLRHEYDYNSRDTSLLNQKATLKFKRVTFDEEYLYEDKDFTDDLENTSLEFSLGLTLDKFDILMKAKTSGKNDYLSLDNLKSVSHTIQGSYKSGCWDMGVSLTFKEYRPIEYDGGYSEREQILYFIVTLRGLGSLKGPVSTIRTSNRVDN